MPDSAPQSFRQELIKLGIVSYQQQDTLFDIAKKCAKQIGVPMGVAGAVATAKAGAVTIPGVGAIPGGVAGFLAGMTAGTFMCTVANTTYREELKNLAEGNSSQPNVFR